MVRVRAGVIVKDRDRDRVTGGKWSKPHMAIIKNIVDTINQLVRRSNIGLAVLA